MAGEVDPPVVTEGGWWRVLTDGEGRWQWSVVAVGARRARVVAAAQGYKRACIAH